VDNRADGDARFPFPAMADDDPRGIRHGRVCSLRIDTDQLVGGGLERAAENQHDDAETIRAAASAEGARSAGTAHRYSAEAFGCACGSGNGVAASLVRALKRPLQTEVRSTSAISMSRG
jgi:hypothetical protein